MNVHVLPSGPIETNAYLLTSPGTGEAILIDAPEGVWADAQGILGSEGCTLSGLWLTHAHWDHIQGVGEVVRATGAPVLAHPGDRLLLENPEIMRALMAPGAALEAVKVDRWLEDGGTLEALGEKAGVRHVPGHCPGSVLFHFPRSAAAFVGDALFKGGVGRTDIPGGDAAQLATSLRTRIYTLPDATVVFPGHGDPTTVGEEKAGNPYVRP